MSHFARRLALFLVLSCGLGAAQAQVVISQVYGGGGNSGAPLKSDFIELHNNGISAVSVAGWSVQYASAAGSSWQVTTLSGSIAPGGYYLVKEADGTGDVTPLPTPDAIGTIAMAGTAGKVALVNATAALSGACPTGNIDFVGYGSTASCAEGTAPTPAPSNTLAVLRAGGGCTDSNVNSADFATGAPAPRNSAASPNVCGGGGLPVLKVADVGQAEGNSGSTIFNFTLSLDQPAGAAGVQAQVRTIDGTATAGSDYVALPATTVSIAPGATSATVGVTVNGDTAVEPNETFYFDVSAVQNALPGALHATGTIQNDDFNLVPIHDIQGAGAASPLAGQVVATSGIVTARRTAGFFIQAADNEADGNPLTSEGIYVFTSSAPPADAAVGNRVSVQGTVQEYVPSADPTQPPLTELGNVTSVVLVSPGNPLPAPVALTTTFPAADGAFDQLERLEGMRVSAASLTVNAPTGGSVNETAATATSNGVFHAVVTGVPLAYREPGVQLPDPLPAGSGSQVPRWNTNPEVVAVSSGALGGPRVDASIGCVVAPVSGPLDYTFRRYTIYPEAALSLTCPNAADQPKPAPAPAADDVSVASFNMERFFDDGNDPAIGEPVLTPAAYQNRLGKASLAIRNYLNTPDIVGTIEIESLAVLQTIAARVNADAVAAGQPDPKYVAYLQEGNDVGGIDVGFLVKTADAAAGIARVEVLSVIQEGKATTWVQPDGSSALLNDRPPLVLKAIVHFADGRNLPLTAIVVHQRSLNGAETDDADGVRVRAKRQKQAEFLANLVQARQAADPNERLLMMGDFNAFEFNDGYGDSMGTTTGLPSADAQTVVAGDGADLVDPDLYNLTLLDTPDVSYSYAFDGNVQSLDHILANAALMQAGDLAGLVIGHARIDANFPETARNDPTTPTRLSDHDPAVVLLKLKAQQLADLGVAASVTPASVVAGQPATFNVDVGNAGADAAAFAAVAFVFDRAVVPTITAPSGWTCAAPVTSNGVTSATCTIDTLSVGGTQRFTLAVNTAAADAGHPLTLAASVTSQTTDRNSANNNAATTLAITAPRAADLALAISGPATLPTSASRADYALTLSNIGTADAARPTLTVEASAPRLSATMKVTAAGWKCALQNGSTLKLLKFVCTGTAAIKAGGSVPFQLTVSRPPAPQNGTITVHGNATTSSPETNLSNNSATFNTVLN